MNPLHFKTIKLTFLKCSVKEHIRITAGVPLDNTDTNATEAVTEIERLVTHPNVSLKILPGMWVFFLTKIKAIWIINTFSTHQVGEIQ